MRTHESHPHPIGHIAPAVRNALYRLRNPPYSRLLARWRRRLRPQGQALRRPALDLRHRADGHGLRPLPLLGLPALALPPELRAGLCSQLGTHRQPRRTGISPQRGRHHPDGVPAGPRLDDPRGKHGDLVDQSRRRVGSGYRCRRPGLGRFNLPREGHPRRWALPLPGGASRSRLGRVELYRGVPIDTLQARRRGSIALV